MISDSDVQGRSAELVMVEAEQMQAFSESWPPACSRAINGYEEDLRISVQRWYVEAM